MLNITDSGISQVCVKLLMLDPKTNKLSYDNIHDLLWVGDPKSMTISDIHDMINNINSIFDIPNGKKVVDIITIYEPNTHNIIWGETVQM